MPSDYMSRFWQSNELSIQENAIKKTEQLFVQMLVKEENVH